MLTEVLYEFNWTADLQELIDILKGIDTKGHTDIVADVEIEDDYGGCTAKLVVTGKRESTEAELREIARRQYRRDKLRVLETCEVEQERINKYVPDEADKKWLEYRLIEINNNKILAL